MEQGVEIEVELQVVVETEEGRRMPGVEDEVEGEVEDEGEGGIEVEDGI
jgi:hypothetical protein